MPTSIATPTRSSFLLPVIILAQFCCTAVWFATNGVMSGLVADFHLSGAALGYLTSAVQFGFIAGTLVFAGLTVADRFPPSRVFFGSALAAAAANGLIAVDGHTLTSLLGCRFATGFFLAGIYPVGMKIAADHFDRGLGRSLGWLVGALVLGTAFPHLLRAGTVDLPWQPVIGVTSGLAVLGGLAMLLLVPDGPHRRPGQPLHLSALPRLFDRPGFRSAAIGYFGHMWELYAFWTFVPVLVAYHTESSALSFSVIAIGSLGCVTGGYLSERIGPPRVARTALLVSGACCLLSPVFLTRAPPWLLLGFLALWGFTVVMDSPLFSTLVANNADPAVKGTALTLVNCIGFSVTVVSIELLNALRTTVSPTYIFMLLAVGPVVGLVGSRIKLKHDAGGGTP